LAQYIGPTQFQVHLRDTIEFFRQNGIGKLVDGYGIHLYASDDPNRPVPARIASLEEGVLSACKPGAKPCWMTEWGFGLADQSCPCNGKVRTKWVQDQRTAFEHFAKRGQLAALIYYGWAEKPGAKEFFGVFRCGAPTGAGKVALSPM
jgi:hypothetical protein